MAERRESLVAELNAYARSGARIVIFHRGKDGSVLATAGRVDMTRPLHVQLDAGGRAATVSLDDVLEIVVRTALSVRAKDGRR